MSTQDGGRTGTIEPPRKRRPRLKTFSSFKYRNFRYLWISTLFTSAGNWVQTVTLGWLAYELTGSALLVGTLSGIRALPFLLVGPIGGVLADRVDRRRLLMATQLTLLALALGFAVLIASDRVEVWHMFAFSLLSGGCWAISNPIRQALVASSVPRESLMNAIALNSAAFNAMRTVGPAIGGLLIALTGPATNFFIQALCFLGVYLAVWPLNIPRLDTSAHRGDSVLTSFREGVRYTLRDPVILALMIVALIPSLFMMPFTMGLMPVFAEDVLQAGPEGLGLLLAGNGVGALVGTLALASAGDVSRKGRVLLGFAMGSGASIMIFSFTTWLPASLLALLAVGACQQLYMSTNTTLLQSLTTDEYRGRVMSLYMLDHGLVPAGGLLAGGLAQMLGVARAVFIGGATTVVLIGVLGTRFRSLRDVK